MNCLWLCCLLVSLISMVFGANFDFSERIVTSPFTSKMYLLHNSHSSSSYTDAKHICSQYPEGKLADITPQSGDIAFLGEFIESLDEPYWMGNLGDTSTSTACAAIYSGGAVAIPKPLSEYQSPCSRNLNVLCEVSL